MTLQRILHEACAQYTHHLQLGELESSPLNMGAIETPLGIMLLGTTDSGVCFVEFSDPARISSQTESLAQHFARPAIPTPSPLMRTLIAELSGYFAGKLTKFSVPIDSPGAPFQTKVWKALRTIPYGQTRSYADIAEQIGHPGAYRAVGTANGKNRVAIVIPCHRVINAGGALGGYGGGLHNKEWLLTLESGNRQSKLPRPAAKKPKQSQPRRKKAYA